MKAGSHVLNRSMKELQEAGYIQLKTGRDEHGKVYKKWHILTKGKKLMEGYMGYLPFTDSGLTVIGFSDDGKVDDTSSNSYKSLEVLRTSNLYVAAGDVQPKGKAMAWEILGDDSKKTTDYDETGSMGKVVDKKEARRKKYAPTKIDKAGKHRADVPESEWKTKHIVAEFNSLINERNIDAQMQLNSAGLASWMNKMVSSGAEYETLLKAVRMFNADPRNFHDVGKGKPIWQRFIAYYQTAQGLASAKPVEYRDAEFDEHQARALKLLKGER